MEMDGARVGGIMQKGPAWQHTRRSAEGFSLIELLMVVGLIAVISAIAVPTTANAVRNFRVTGDARSLSNAINLAKMRASSTFDRTRVFVDLTTRNYSLQRWHKTALTWVTEQSTPLSAGVTFSVGSLSTPPPNTQATIAQSPQCLDDSGSSIANSACVIFNSRGIPIDSSGAPTGADAFYVSDGISVNGVTVSATGLGRVWHSLASSAEWKRQ